jgi:hypothetical protein
MTQPKNMNTYVYTKTADGQATLREVDETATINDTIEEAPK